MVIQNVIKKLVIAELSGERDERRYVLGNPTGTICEVPTLKSDVNEEIWVNPDYCQETSYYSGELDVVLAHPDWPNDFAAHVCVRGFSCKVNSADGKCVESLSVNVAITGMQSGFRRRMTISRIL